MMEALHMLYEVSGNVVILTLNRPEVRNAFSAEMIRLWREYLQKAQEDTTARVIVVTGKGDNFCIALTLEDMDKPVIAAINGAAMGAGLDMALMCDLRICSDRAKLGESYILMGVAPGDGGAYYLPRLVGTAKALELCLTGDVVTAQEAAAMGMVNRVVPHEQLMEETMKLAAKIAAKPPLAIRMIKRAVYQGLTSTLRAHLDCISSHLAILSETKDHREAARAFLEKRKPVFEGR
jgi:enoyl-CoA hydratase/carnithine racemase